MRAFSYAWTLLVTWERWQSHRSIHSSQNPMLHTNFTALSVIELELWLVKVLHCGHMDFLPFCSCDLDLDLDPMGSSCMNMIRIPWSCCIPDVQIWWTSYVKAFEVIVWHSENKIIYHAALRVVKKEIQSIKCTWNWSDFVSLQPLLPVSFRLFDISYLYYLYNGHLSLTINLFSKTLQVKCKGRKSGDPESLSCSEVRSCIIDACYHLRVIFHRLQCSGTVQHYYSCCILYSRVVMCDKLVICYLLCIICYEISLQFVLHWIELFNTFWYCFVCDAEYQAFPSWEVWNGNSSLDCSTCC